MRLTVLMVLCGVLGSDAKPSKLHVECDKLVANGEKAYYFANSCVVISTTTMNWANALAACTQFNNGHLLVLPTAREVNKALEKFDEWNTEARYGWIGLVQANDTSEPLGHWQWITTNNRKVPTTAGHTDVGWDAGKPDDTTGAKQCAAFGFNKLIFDDGCQWSHDTHCQYDEERAERHYREILKGHEGHPSARLGEQNNVVNKLLCARLCSEDSMCRSFSYSKNNQHCIISHDDGTHPDYPPQTNGDYDLLQWEF